MFAIIQRPLLALLLLMAIFVALDSPGQRKLFNPDEGRYSEISREMAASGDFVTPRLNGLKYFEKPPLQYWATAVAFKLFGESELTARLYITLCGLGCILLVAYTGTRVLDNETGLLAGLVMLSSLYVMLLNEIVVLDVGLTLWLTLAVSALMISEYALSEVARKRWVWLGWAGMALAVLSKGLIGIVFPAAAVFLYCVVQRDLRLIRRLEWVVGLLVFLAISAPWFLLVWHANPEHPQFFFIHEHFERFLTTVHRREQPWWSFIALLLVGFLPWAFALIPAAIHGWRKAPSVIGQNTFAPLRFLLIYSVFILLFFSKSGSKLPHYIAPMFPVLALVIAAYLKARDPRRLAWFILPVLPLAMWGAYATGPALAARANDFSRAMYAQTIPYA
jgi:4-amino-4-deoxy-L-arabinose transferase-like glycosyltransferase